jgi:hypothetical protein
MTFSSAEMQEHLLNSTNLVNGFDASFKAAAKWVYEVYSWHMRVGNTISGRRECVAAHTFE